MEKTCTCPQCSKKLSFTQVFFLHKKSVVNCSGCNVNICPASWPDPEQRSSSVLGGHASAIALFFILIAFGQIVLGFITMIAIQVGLAVSNEKWLRKSIVFKVKSD